MVQGRMGRRRAVAAVLAAACCLAGCDPKLAYWPSADGWGAARIEEEVVVTADGCEVITKFPAEELLVAGQRYYSVGGPLDLTRDSQSHLNTTWGRGEA